MTKLNKSNSVSGRLRKRLSGIIFLCILVCAVRPEYVYAEQNKSQAVSVYDQMSQSGWPTAPEINAESAVLIDADTGEVLYAKNAETKRYPASITKILTALLTIENSELSDDLVFEGDALIKLPAGYVSVDPTEGEVMSVEDCLYGLLLESFNDCANALAVHNSGSIASFAPVMNERAKQAGALNTHFTNPSGFADEDHYTTAYDMAMILRACVAHEEFLTIAGSLSYTIPATNYHAARSCAMRHQMLYPTSKWYDSRVKAGKTGHTTPAGYTLVTYAGDDNLNLICVVMKCQDGGQYSSTKALLDYGFDNFSHVSGDTITLDTVLDKADELGLTLMSKSSHFSMSISEAQDMLLPTTLSASGLDMTMERLDPNSESDGAVAKLMFSHEGVELNSVRLYVSGSTNSVVAKIAYDKLHDYYVSLAKIAAILLLVLAATIYMIISSVLRRKKYKKALAELEAEEGAYEISDEPVSGVWVDPEEAGAPAELAGASSAKDASAENPDASPAKDASAGIPDASLAKDASAENPDASLAQDAPAEVLGSSLADDASEKNCENANPSGNGTSDGAFPSGSSDGESLESTETDQKTEADEAIDLIENINYEHYNNALDVIEALSAAAANKVVNAVEAVKKKNPALDYEHAKQAFEAYLKQFDRFDPKILLKIIHTYGVVDCSEKLATGMGMDEENVELAKIIALLHDIGRFEQVAQFDSFEPSVMDHAQYGVKLLFENGAIRDYISDPSWDNIIKTAIGWHSAYSLPATIADEQTRIHAKLIRDADKLDNCRVKLETPVETLMGVSAEEIGAMNITDTVYDSIRSKESILLETRITKMDYWVSYLAYFYDIYFAKTFELIKEEGYVDRIIDRIPYSNQDTKDKMVLIREELTDHVNDMCVYGEKPVF